MTELTQGVYPLAPDCKAFVRDGKVIVSSKRKVIDTTPRCRDCRHFGMGHSKYNQRHDSPVCLARPKDNGNTGYAPQIRTQQRYYSTQGCFRACNKFNPKDPNNGKTSDYPSR